MGRPTLAENLALAAIVLASGCASDHHVSPWGGRTGPSFAPFVPRPDLEGRLAVVDAEAASLGLSRAVELRVELPGKAGPAVIRGYDGHDAAGRPVHAVRVATPLGVVLALGPLDTGDLDRRQATELVPALREGGAYRTGTELAGDGRLAVVLRSEAGALAIWHFDALGSGAYDIVMEAPPARGIDVDGDGRVDLAGELPIEPGDPIAPRLADVATFDGARYSDASAAARAWHAGLAVAPVKPGKGSGVTPRAAGQGAPRPLAGGDPARSPPDVNEPDAARLRAALERAWHAILAGQPVDSVLQELRREPVPPALRASFDGHARVIAGLATRR